MKKIEFEDIIPYHEYIKIRKDFQDRIIKLKKNRRVQVGNYITFVFENRQTVLYQIQEMIRLEKMTDERLIKNEIEVFNQLIPGENELCATMLIEIFERHLIKPILNSLIGIHDKKIFLQFDDISITPIFYDENLAEGKISAVQYVKFTFTKEQTNKFIENKSPAKILVNHENYKAETIIPENVRASLIEDLKGL
ncbi:MAG: DUF3501 family protein [Ignavibacteria bacterium]|nr:DUF3501 family protein [Ignavibacteria bacterium]